MPSLPTTTSAAFYQRSVPPVRSAVLMLVSCDRGELLSDKGAPVGVAAIAQFGELGGGQVPGADGILPHGIKSAVFHFLPEHWQLTLFVVGVA